MAEIMNWKSLKEFLRPDWRKIVIVLIIFAYLYFFSRFLSAIYIACPKQPDFFDFHCGSFFEIVEIILFWPLYFFHNFVFGILYWYLISCLIIWIYDKVKKK